MLKYSLFSLLRITAFFQRLFFSLVLNHRTLAATALYEIYNMPIIEKIQSIYCLFLERKLYGFPQSELLHFVFVCKVNVVLNIFCLDTPY